MRVNQTGRSHQSAVPLPRPLVPVVLVRRVNRFAVSARHGGRRLYLHLPNSGRMEELLRAGAQGVAHLLPQPSGRTDGVLLLIRHRGRWVGLDARMPNRLFAAALEAGTLRPFRGYARRRPEVRFPGGRVDYVLEGGGVPCLVETKSCNRVDGTVALFPDAPSARGARHLRALAAAVQRGWRAAVVWFVQRDDATVLRPFAAADPRFAAEARRAAARGVEFYAYTCRVTLREMAVRRQIPVDLASVSSR
ncbi:MAG: DNA/RNA nuclease SfsA [Armatimonadota bacterium]|nr:DNA/RNA nuclease SfsA [Armatimonadota bacterium]MDR7464253.1 DNA/RNA nuclease SfsA [Armatimonadota bacterium]MDR7540099.1 DNA/RNA nuclease SfsA [Armatimonadota bacterium]